MAHTFNPTTWESHAFNPSTGKVETGRDSAEQREEYKVGRGQTLSTFSLRTPRDRMAIRFENSVEVEGRGSGWLLCFPDSFRIYPYI